MLQKCKIELKSIKQFDGKVYIHDRTTAIYVEQFFDEILIKKGLYQDH